MALADVTKDASTPRFLGVGYGHSGCGKTNWATAYPDEWGEALYFGAEWLVRRLGRAGRVG